MGNFLKRSELTKIVCVNTNSDDPDAAHINLKVVSIITSEGIFNDKIGIKKISPQQIVSVITNDVKFLDTDIGLICPKMKIHRSGLLVFPSGGIIHPSYKGPITLQFVNFSKNDISLAVGESVAELLVFRNDDNFVYNRLPSSETYLNDRLREIQAYPLSFMDTKNNEDWLSTKTGLSTIKCLSGCVVILTLFLTIWTVCYTMSSSTES